MADLKGKEYKKFEDIKHTEGGIEFWYARELAECLEYEKWANFNKVINRAMLSCKNSGYEVPDQFAEVGKLITHAKGGKRKIIDYKLTRYACYLIVQNAGYMGLYGGETVEDIHKRKGLTKKQKILDYMNSQELIANLFRISLADEKLKKEKISNSEDANVVHNKVGQEVRAAIKRVGGVLPENQPTPEKSIDEIAKEQIKKLKKQKKLMLDE